MFGLKVKLPVVPRMVRHALIAAALAFLVAFVHLLQPVDVVFWRLQSRLGHVTPSGEMLFVEMREDTLEGPNKDQVLNAALRELGQAGSRTIFIDLPLGRFGNGNTQSAALEGIDGLDKVRLVGRPLHGDDEGELRFPIENEQASKIQKVAAGRSAGPFGYFWSVPGKIVREDRSYGSFAHALARRDGEAGQEYHIDYRFVPEDFLTLNISDVANSKFDPNSVIGRDVVIGFVSMDTNELPSMPGSGEASISFVPIFAAESMKAGNVAFVDRFEVLGVFALLLFLAAAFLNSIRRYAYLLIGIGFAASLIAPIFTALRIESGASLILLLAYAAMRGLSRWRGSIEMNSGQTGLPTLKALTRKLEADQLQERRAVVAAKLHGLSDVLAVLGDEQKLEYFGGIAKRLKIANTELEIFSDDGEHLVWSDVFEERGILESHLLALRAIFAKPLEIDGKQVDVTVTFSADLSFTDAASRRIGNAIALVDKTSLADLPILLDDQQDVMDREWKVSLQSSIDNALQTGAIFAVFQPKVSLKTGRICGYEALVRWNDPERGFISPAYFIEQCEQAGRMEKLTRFMLEESMRKFQVSDAYQYGGTLSVNVSSTMLSNTSLPEIVCDILEKVGFPEDRLIIEVTETARIHDQLTARSVLSALSAVGVGLSLDDFGTGSAGLETLYNYPFSEIKIDRAFVKDITTSAKARTICEEVVTLGKKLRMNLVAEGIEDQETLQLLTDMGCPTAQGYYLGRPEPTPALDALQKVRLAKN